MADDVRPRTPGAKTWRKTIRLTFQTTGGEVKLLSEEHLDMICPPVIGQPPEGGRHGGYWMELRDARDQVLFHRLLHSPFASSVEVHSPDGKIQRVFGPPMDGIFEVLVPEAPEARSVALMGEPPDPKSGMAREGGSREIARFDLAGKDQRPDRSDRPDQGGER